MKSLSLFLACVISTSCGGVEEPTNKTSSAQNHPDTQPTRGFCDILEIWRQLHSRRSRGICFVFGGKKQLNVCTIYFQHIEYIELHKHHLPISFRIPFQGHPKDHPKGPELSNSNLPPGQDIYSSTLPDPLTAPSFHLCKLTS